MVENAEKKKRVLDDADNERPTKAAKLVLAGKDSLSVVYFPVVLTRDDRIDKWTTFLDST